MVKNRGNKSSLRDAHGNSKAEYEKLQRLIETIPFVMHTLMGGFSIPEQTGLNKTQIRTLMMIYWHHSSHMGYISNRLNLEKGSFTSVVDSIRRKKLIELAPVPDDRRKKQIVLTDRGRDMVQSLQNSFAQHLQSKLEVLTERQQKELFTAAETLRTIAEKLEDKG
jgi:DNA-binding MarR family transcriptional regulator